MELENCQRDLVAFVTSKDLYSHERSRGYEKKASLAIFQLHLSTSVDIIYRRRKGERKRRKEKNKSRIKNFVLERKLYTFIPEINK